MYTIASDAPMFLLGDFNKRIGDKQDVDHNIDPDVPTRSYIDTTFRNADKFLDFLRDSRFCVLNGRFNPMLDNYTCYTNRGHSVVDYICTGYGMLEYVHDFKVVPVSEAIAQFDICPIQKKTAGSRYSGMWSRPLGIQ